MDYGTPPVIATVSMERIEWPVGVRYRNRLRLVLGSIRGSLKRNGLQCSRTLPGRPPNIGRLL